MQDAAATVDRLLAAEPALEVDDWALGRAGLETVLAQLDAGRREIVECGSGVSTVVMARRLRELGAGRVTSLEHRPEFAAATRGRLDAEGLGDRAAVVDAPLRPHPDTELGWYDRAALGLLPDAGIELLLVDGPPAGTPALERSRYPALPELAARLAPSAAILLDDADRPGERWVLDRWLGEFSLRLRPAPPGTALALYIPPGFGGDPNEDTERKV
jgi:hypothetical protein